MKSTVSAILLSATIMSTASFAQSGQTMSPGARLNSAIENIKAACKGEVEKYCTTVTPGEGRLFFCLLAHEDKVGLACDHAVYRSISDLTWVIDKLEELADACSGDIEKLCPAAEPGQGEIAACLQKNSKATSAACRASLEKFSSQ